MWVNSGLSVTTTTAQTVNDPVTVNLPNRDNSGSSNGEGCYAGILFTGTTANAAAITNSTITYTNSAGTGSRTGTLGTLSGGDRIPPTAIIGTITWFLLAAGDKGVRSIQALTLGTSLGSGAISLIIARPVAAFRDKLSSNVNRRIMFEYPGIRIYNGSNLHGLYKTATPTATTIQANVVLAEE